MAKKGVPKVAATAAPAKMAIRLELPIADYERVERRARKLGLNRASYARMAVLRTLQQDEEEEQRKNGK